MVTQSGIGSGARLALAAAATVAVVGGGVFLAANGSLGLRAQAGLRMVYDALGGGDDTFAISVPLSAGGNSEARSLVAPTPSPAGTKTVTEQAAQAPQEAATPHPAPVLDLVRIEPDGSGLVAGSAQPGTTVKVLLDGTEIQSLTVPAEGEFATFVTIEPSNAPQVLSLLSSFETEEVGSDAQFILTPTIAPISESESAPQEPDAQTPAALAALPDAPAPEGALPDATIAQSAVTSPQETTAQDTEMQPPSQSVAEPTQKVAMAPTDLRPDTPRPEAASTGSQASLNQAPVSQEPVSQEPVTEQQKPDAQQGLQQQVASQADAVVQSAPKEEPEPTTAAPQEVTTASPASPATPRAQATAVTAIGTPQATRDIAADGDAPLIAAPRADAAETQIEADENSAPKPAAAVTVLRADKDGVSLVQSGTTVAPDLVNKIALDTISYSDSGDVQLAGRATPLALVRVYLDNSPVLEMPSQQDGHWSGRLVSVAPGIYTLRLDEIDPIDGKVLSRLETPFKRETPEALTPVARDSTPGGPSVPTVRAVTVQTGDTLWAISQDRYGSGFLYVRVFEANKGAIRDPDLIYPGQIFTLPE